MRSTWWTAEKKVRAVHLWTVEKWSAGKIAAEMGTTRNAIIGKTSRLGLKRSKPKPPALTLDRYPSKDGCVFPLGDMKAAGQFCGAPALLPRPYCGKHCAIAYHKVAPRDP